MPSTQNSRKRRVSSAASSTRNVRGRAAHATGPSSSRNGSRFQTPSRHPSSDSRQGSSRNRTPAYQASAASSSRSATASSAGIIDPGLVRIAAARQSAPPTSEADFEALDEVIMAVHMAERKTVGCAYYVAREEKLYFLEDVKMGGGEVVDQLKMFVEPTVVLVSTKCEDEVMDRLDPEMRDPSMSDGGRSGDQTRLPYLLECRPNADFGYDAARNKLVNLRIGQGDGPRLTFVVPGDVTTEQEDVNGQDIGFVGRQGQLLRLSGWINIESRTTVGCAGAVLTYLQRRRGASYLPGDPAAQALFRVATVEMFTLSGTMFINTDTLASLQITSMESHPNAQNQGPPSKGWTSGAKEGFSIYGLFHQQAKTAQGRALLRQYFLRPSVNLEVINERLNTVAILLRPDNSAVLDNLTDALSKIKNLRIVIINLRKGISNGLDRNKRIASSIWPTLRHFSFYTLSVLDALVDLQGSDRLTLRAKVEEAFDRRQLAGVGKLINDIIDIEASKVSGHTLVRPGVDADLDEAKRTYDGIEDLLSHVASHVADHVPAELNSKVNVIFFPQIGFLISIRLDEDTGTGVWEGTADDPWEKMFVTEENVYYKNSNMNELDAHFGDIYGRICDKEIEIVQQLGVRILESEDLLTTCSDLCGELDAHVALAQTAARHNLVRPRMTIENVVHIEGGRHPLQELTVPSYVANDTYLIGGSGQPPSPTSSNDSHTPDPRSPRPQGPSTLLLTGPNYSGKSVHLKSVALTVFLAHIGSFVPCTSATIGLTDAILTRISTRESVSRISSAFMIDLQQISLALKQATRRSLVVVDEFGKGTESYDGAGLAAGVFEHFLARGADAPKVVGATHFHEIFSSRFLPPRPGLAFVHMEVRVADDSSTGAGESGERVTYLYNLRPGKSSESFGTVCAALNGVDKGVVARAEELIALAADGEDLVEVLAGVSEGERAELADAEEVARDFLENDLDGNPRRMLDDLLTVAGSSTYVS